MIIDISQKVISCKVFPGDPEPTVECIQSIEQGDSCNLTAFSMCAHNGTHVDAPSHFIEKGKTIGEVGLDSFVGDCFVARFEGNIGTEDAINIIKKATEAKADKRILIAGKVTVTIDAARIFAQSDIKLIGNESQTVGPEDSPKEVHLILLGADVVLLEGIVLTDVSEGKYFLNAAPLNLSDCEGSPCRAYLIKSDI